jgi:hypothetical protein
VLDHGSSSFDRRRSPPGRARAATAARVGALAGLAVAVLCVAAAPARALQTPLTQSKVQLLGGLRFASHDLNLGIGFRGGYTLPVDVYIGGTFDYFFGEHDDWVFNDQRWEYGFSVWQISGEGGYDFGLTSNLMLRPFGGLSIVHAEFDYCDDRRGGSFCCWEGDDTDIGLTLGGLLHIAVGPLIVGPELRLLIFDDAVFILGGHIGGMF